MDEPVGGVVGCVGVEVRSIEQLSGLTMGGERGDRWSEGDNEREWGTERGVGGTGEGDELNLLK